MGRFKRWYIENPDMAFLILAVIAFVAVFFGLPHLIIE